MRLLGSCVLTTLFPDPNQKGEIVSLFYLKIIKCLLKYSYGWRAKYVKLDIQTCIFDEIRQCLIFGISSMFVE